MIYSTENGNMNYIFSKLSFSKSYYLRCLLMCIVLHIGKLLLEKEKDIELEIDKERVKG